MSKNIYTSFLSLFILMLVGCSTPHLPKRERVEKKLVILDHNYFKVAYDPQARLANYVIYELTAGSLMRKNSVRRNKFKADPLLVKKGLPFVRPEEYRKTKYDKGHLAPAGDFNNGQDAKDTTFFMSNMVPQRPGLNRGPWKRLEDKVRRWACGEERITVITGPVMKAGLMKFPSGLPIPEQFFKIVIDETPPKKSMAFIYHQTDSGDVMEKRIVSLREVESRMTVSLSSILPGRDFGQLRLPANTNEWKEKKCD